MATGYVVRRADGTYFQGCGYGGIGSPVPYFGEELRRAKVYRTPKGALEAAKRFGGHAGAADVSERGEAVAWRGFLVWRRGRLEEIMVAPREFDPNDYEGNNGPLG